MTKSKIFIGSAALVLAVGSFLATKANHKFATFSVAPKIATALTGSLTASTTAYTTVSKAGYVTVFFKTLGNGNLSTLVTATNKLHRVYYR